VFPTFKIDGVEQAPNNVAVDFNNHFLNITESLNIQIAKDSDPISLLKKSYPAEIPPMQTIPISEGEIKCIINSLNSKNSSGYDEIPTKIFNFAETKLVKVWLSFFINQYQWGSFLND
jgi:hypothetical protein